MDLHADLYIDENKLILLHTILALLSFCRSSMYNVSAGSTRGSNTIGGIMYKILTDLYSKNCQEIINLGPKSPNNDSHSLTILMCSKLFFEYSTHMVYITSCDLAT